MSSHAAPRFSGVVMRGIGLWLVGMVVGTIVFSIPALRSAAPIPGVTANPYITIPIIACWIPMAWLMTKTLVARSANPAADALRIGALFLAVNVALDLAVVVGAMHSGVRFYSFAGVWLAYAVLAIVPWMSVRR